MGSIVLRKKLLNILKRMEVNVLCFVDSYEKKTSKIIEGTEVLSKDILLNRNGKYTTVVVAGNYLTKDKIKKVGAVHAIRRAAPCSDNTVAVCGLGTIGLFIIKKWELKNFLL